MDAEIIEENLIAEDPIKSVEDIVNELNDKEEKPKKSKRKYTRKPKPKTKPAEEIFEDLNELQMTDNYVSEYDQKKQLVEDLDILCYKFKEVISYSPKYSFPETSVGELERQKSLMLRIVGEKASINASFEVLLFMCRGGEKITNSLGVLDLEGLSGDIEVKKEPIIEILKELVDTGIISVEEVKPEVKLLILMSNIVVNRMEINKAKKKQENLVAVIDEGAKTTTQSSS